MSTIKIFYPELAEEAEVAVGIMTNLRHPNLTCALCRFEEDVRLETPRYDGEPVSLYLAAGEDIEIRHSKGAEGTIWKITLDAEPAEEEKEPEPTDKEKEEGGNPPAMMRRR